MKPLELAQNNVPADPGTLEGISVYEATGEQVQLYHYQNGLPDDGPPQMLALDMLLEQPDVGSVKRAIEIMIRRHESLRTFFRVVDGSVVQCVAPYEERYFLTACYDVSGDEDARQSIIRIMDEERKFLKTLDAPPLLRSCLIKVSVTGYYVSILVHHLIADEWSRSLMIAEVTRLYESLKAGQAVDEKPNKMQLRDYAVWQKKWMDINKDAACDYWKKKLTSFEENVFFEGLYREYTTDYDGSPVGDGSSMATGPALEHLLDISGTGYYSYIIPPELYTGLKQLSQRCGCGILTITCVSLKLAIFSLTGRKKALIAMPVANRLWPGADTIIGYMVGGLYLHQEIREDMTILDLVNEVFLDFLESNIYLIYDHAAMDLENLDLRFICDVFVNFMSGEMNSNKSIVGEKSGDQWNEEAPSFYALSLYLTEYSDGLRYTWRYNTSLYPRKIIDRVIDQYSRILSAICAATEIPIGKMIKGLPACSQY
jgi:hypothetical protein